MHDRSEAWCHQTKLAAHRPRPVRNLFNVDHRRRGRLKAGGEMVGSVTSDWLTTVVLNHASDMMNEISTLICLYNLNVAPVRIKGHSSKTANVILPGLVINIGDHPYICCRKVPLMRLSGEKCVIVDHF